ncbi:redoxin domain-containing protein [Mycobacteroides abscessus]|uniref:redoxin domain-containing protein n=1 Tax=Mycobacteroides abscessus TaxID=36809 RepID=UPI000AECE75B|nr:redoxin domain-containing protein [Mycobacteroides abscessus]MDO3201359.1 redoxin domain-containing protein [Mycobacteroides abscessus subsp. abscessus]MDO3336852.1 redoxin domain-containing protein [Mycobacteroides abscessus subsp. abscessus]
MKNSAILLVGAAVVITGCSPARTLFTTQQLPAANPHASTLTSGPTAPWQLQFIAQSLDGAGFSGEDLWGKPAVLWFWEPSCAACKQQAAIVQAAAAKHPDITFVGVGIKASTTDLRTFTRHYPMEFTQIIDTSTNISSRFAITRTPSYAFITENGAINTAKNPLSQRDLTRQIDKLSQD